MPQEAILLHFDPEGLVTMFEQKGQLSKRQRASNLRTVKKAARNRLPYTVHVPKKRRNVYWPIAGVWTACDGCTRRVDGTNKVRKCRVCGRGVYCSEQCREEHAKEHKSACVNSASDAVSRVYDDMVSILDTYFGPHEAHLIEGLAAFEYYEPLSSACYTDLDLRERLNKIELWICFVILKQMAEEVSPVVEESESIPCMTCSEATPLTKSAISSIVVTTEDQHNTDVASFNAATALGDVPDLMKIEFLGVEKNTSVHGRYYVFCSDTCRKNHNPLFNPYGTFDIWKTVLSQMTKIHITYAN